MSQFVGASGTAELCAGEQSGFGVAFFGFLPFRWISIVEQQQAASGTGEMREAEQAGEGVTILLFLLSRWGSH